MKNSIKIVIQGFVVFALVLAFFSCTADEKNYDPDVVKVALREVGHQLLLSNQDSTSIVKPVISVSKNKYQLAFEKELSIHPDSLVTTIKNSFSKAELPSYYLVEVLQCEDSEVAYSYAMNSNVEKGIVPCGGRELKEHCYLITVRFTQISKAQESNAIIWYVLVIIGLISAVVIYKRKGNKLVAPKDSNYASLGRFKFYPEQNKLIKEATEISLSKKECELLAIFVANPNQIVKREELTKKVWEDNGVVVGRSLDTYISKLRNKLKEDTSIKLTNVHGVGYKLEIK